MYDDITNIANLVTEVTATGGSIDTIKLDSVDNNILEVNNDIAQAKINKTYL